MAETLITIGITSFNAEETIRAAILSALAQGWPYKEIILVDDVSSDRTVEIVQDVIKELSLDDGLFRIIENAENSGVAASRNKIIAEAKGDFIAFFDDDDTSHPDRLEKQYDRITRYENQFSRGAPVICHTARTQVYPNGSTHCEPTMGADDRLIAPHGVDVAARILIGTPMPGAFGSMATCSQMARTKTYRDLNGFDVSFRRSEDTDFNVRLALAGGHFAGISEPLVTQRMTPTGDKKINDEMHFALMLLEKNKVFIGQKTSFDFCKNWIVAKYTFLGGFRVRFFGLLLLVFLKYPVLTMKRFMVSLPNLSFNARSARYYHDHGQ